MNKIIKDNLNIIIGFLISFFVIFGIVVLNSNNVLNEFELKTLDLRFKTLSRLMKPPSKDIIIVGIDDSSITKIGRWPWNRDKHAKIINFLKLYKAKIIVFDIFFSNADKEHLQSDREFAQAIKNAGNVFLAGKFIPFQDKEFSANTDKKLSKLSIDIKNIPFKNAEETMPSGQKPFYELPISEFFNNAKKVGTVHISDNNDGRIRYQDLIYRYNDHYYPSLSLAIALDLVDEHKVYRVNKSSIGFADKKVFLDENNRMLVNWKSNYDKHNKALTPPYLQYSAFKLIDGYDNILKASKACGLSPEKFKKLMDEVFYYQSSGKNVPDKVLTYLDKIPSDFEFKFNGYNPTDLFKNKIVLVGVSSTSTTVRDFISTPIFQDIPGVYLHANTVDNLLNNDSIRKTGKLTTNLTVIGMSILTLMSVFAIRKTIFASIIPLILAILYIAASILAFLRYNTWIDIIHVELAIILTLALSSITYYVMEGKSKKLIKQAMANYISPQIMDAVLDNPSLLKLGGEKRELTILFSDIRSFTTLSESIDAEEIVTMLNEYFSKMVEIILKNKGTVDKFIGDSIMAFWNAPLKTEDHAYLAVKSGIKMIEELEKLKGKWQSEGKKTIDIGISINTGEVIVGNIGSQSIKDYTIIGDNVNTTSRIEGLNSEYMTRLLISESTYEKVKDKVNCTYLTSKRLKGKNKFVRIYEVTLNSNLFSDCPS